MKLRPMVRFMNVIHPSISFMTEMTSLFVPNSETSYKNVLYVGWSASTLVDCPSQHPIFYHLIYRLSNGEQVITSLTPCPSFSLFINILTCSLHISAWHDTPLLAGLARVKPFGEFWKPEQHQPHQPKMGKRIVPTGSCSSYFTLCVDTVTDKHKEWAYFHITLHYVWTQ